MNAVPQISVEELEATVLAEPRTVILDVRSRDEFEAWSFEAPKARILNVPEAEVDPSNGSLEEIEMDTRINVLCAAGNASGRVTEKLIAAGRDAVNVEGGMIAWSRLLVAEEVPVEGDFTVIQFRREARGCLSYLIEHGGEALVVDPAPDPTPYLKAAEERGWKIVASFDTHVHADHVSGAAVLANQTGARELMPKAALERGLDRPNVELVADGDTIDLGGGEVRVIALPGHTTEMTGLEFANALVTGDSLFSNSIARPDLQHPDPAAARAAANDLYLTLTSQILSRPKETVVLPGHYPGGRLDGSLAPTLEEVRSEIDELSLGAEPFVDWVVGDLPEKPSNHNTIIGINLGIEQVPDDDVGRLEVGGNSCAAR